MLVRHGATMSSIQLLMIAAVALGIRLFVAWAVPLGLGDGLSCAPDEFAHFIVVRELASGRARVWPELHSSESVHLPSQYALQAGIFSLSRGADSPRLYRFSGWHPYFQGYLFARLGNVVLGVLTALILALAASVWTGSSMAGLVAGLAVAFYPQHVFVSSYVNSDAMTIAAGAALTLAVARWARAGEQQAGLLFVGVAIGLVVLGRVNGYALLPPTLAWIAWAKHRGRVQTGDVLRATAAALVVCGPVLMFNALRNAGDPLGLANYRRFLATEWQPIPPPSNPVRVFVTSFGRSSFGLFGNMNLPLHWFMYCGAFAVLLIGSIWAVFELRRVERTVRAAALWLAASVMGSVVLVALFSWFVNFDPQGRHALLPMLLLALIAIVAPASRSSHRMWRLWPAVGLCFLAMASVDAAWVIYSNPCGTSWNALSASVD